MQGLTCKPPQRRGQSLDDRPTLCEIPQLTGASIQGGGNKGVAGRQQLLICALDDGRQIHQDGGHQSTRSPECGKVSRRGGGSGVYEAFHRVEREGWVNNALKAVSENQSALRQLPRSDVLAGVTVGGMKRCTLSVQHPDDQVWQQSGKALM